MDGPNKRYNEIDFCDFVAASLNVYIGNWTKDMRSDLGKHLLKQAALILVSESNPGPQGEVK